MAQASGPIVPGEEAPEGLDLLGKACKEHLVPPVVLELGFEPDHLPADELGRAGLHPLHRKAPMCQQPVVISVYDIIGDLPDPASPIIDLVLGEPVQPSKHLASDKLDNSSR